MCYEPLGIGVCLIELHRGKYRMHVRKHNIYLLIMDFSFFILSLCRDGT